MTDHTDIVERLNALWLERDLQALWHESVAEITRLRAEAEALRKAHRAVLHIALTARATNSKGLLDWVEDLETVEKLAYAALDATKGTT